MNPDQENSGPGYFERMFGERVKESWEKEFDELFEVEEYTFDDDMQSKNRVNNDNADEIKEFIASLLSRQKKEVERWVEDPQNISVGQAGDFRPGDIVVLKRHLISNLNYPRGNNQKTPSKTPTPTVAGEEDRKG